jgi:DNA-binding transcriptional regulator YhcF (GntR family)
MTSLLVLLNQASPVPPYEQIGLQIRTMIASAQLAPGTLLPSVRQLARDLGVAPNTVVRAYSELERNGWVVTSMRKGVMVAPRPPMLTSRERQQRLEQAVSELLVSAYPLDVSAEDIHAEIDRQWGRVGARA